MIRNSEEDYRACVRFTLSGLTTFTVSATRPDPSLTSAQLISHRDNSTKDVIFVSDLAYDRGGLRGYSFPGYERMILDVVDMAVETPVHEYGHLAHLEHEDHKDEGLIMCRGGNPTTPDDPPRDAGNADELINIDVSAYDGGPAVP